MQLPSLIRVSSARILQRGLSPAGNTATLFTRIRCIENGHSASASARATSTLNVKLPDLDAPEEPRAPHIPFLPDFWDSSRTRGADAIHHNADTEAPMRKVLVVSGTAAQHAGGPTYGPTDHAEHEQAEAEQAEADIDHVVNYELPFWGDVCWDIILALDFPKLVTHETEAPFNKVRDMVLSFAEEQPPPPENPQPSPHARPLTPDEAKGVWVLLGILAGSWLAGGIFKKKDHPSK